MSKTPSSLWILAALASNSRACRSSLRSYSARSPSVFFRTASSSASTEKIHSGVRSHLITNCHPYHIQRSNESTGSDVSRTSCGGVSVSTWRSLLMLLSMFRMFLVFCSSWMVSAWAARSSRRLPVASPTSFRKSTSFWAFRVCGVGGGGTQGGATSNFKHRRRRRRTSETNSHELTLMSSSASVSSAASYPFSCQRQNTGDDSRQPGRHTDTSSAVIGQLGPTTHTANASLELVAQTERVQNNGSTCRRSSL